MNEAIELKINLLSRKIFYLGLERQFHEHKVHVACAGLMVQKYRENTYI